MFNVACEAKRVSKCQCNPCFKSKDCHFGVNKNYFKLNRTHGVPVNALLVDEDPHELGDGQCRMCVVQLNGDLVRHLREVVARDFADAELGVLVSVIKIKTNNNLNELLFNFCP